MIRISAFSLGLQVVLLSSFALAQSTLPIVDPAGAPAQPVAPNVAPLNPAPSASTGPNAVPNTTQGAPTRRWVNHHEPSPREKCNFELRELAHHLRGVDAMVSRDGSSISINTENRKKFGKVEANLAGLGSKVEIFGRDGKSSVDGLSCSFDKTKRVGDGAAKLIEIFQNEEKIRQQFEQAHRQAAQQASPNKGWVADPARRHHEGDHANEFLNHVVEQCSQVYPQVEALRAPLNLPAAPLPQAQAAAPAATMVK
jgi:hypothetical protein